MARRRPHDPKAEALRENGTLNPKAEKVRDPDFSDHDFLDARDLLQVKYEMLRRVHLDGHSIAGTAEQFGLSRPTFYKAQADYERDGLAGLLPGKRGPRGAHKLTEEVMDLIESERSREENLGAAQLAQCVWKRLGVSVHPRTIERGLARSKKKVL